MSEVKANVVVTKGRPATWTERFQHKTAPVITNTFAATGVVARSALIEGPKAFWAAFTLADATQPKTQIIVVDGKTIEVTI